MRKCFSVFKYGTALLGAVFLSTALYAAEEAAPGAKGMSDEEFTPVKEVMSVKFVQMEKPYHISIHELGEAFHDAKGVTVNLQMQDKAFPNGGGSVKTAEVKGIHDGTTIFFQVSWDDPTKDSRVIAPQQFRDGAALMFPLGKVTISTEEKFSPRMGDRQKPVNLWNWKADWEVDLVAASGICEVSAQYPGMHDDFSTNPISPTYHKGLMQSPSILAGGISAANLFSLPNRGRVVEDLNAEGFGTLTTQDHQDVNGCSEYEHGRWTVIMYRPLNTGDTFDVQFVPGGTTYFNMAIWNGDKEDRNGQKNISTQWHPLELERIAW